MRRYYLLFNLVFVPLDIVIFFAFSTGFINFEHFDRLSIIFSYAIIFLMLALPNLIGFAVTKRPEANNTLNQTIAVNITGLKIIVFLLLTSILT